MDDIIHVDLTKYFNLSLVNTEDKKICFLKEDFPGFNREIFFGNTSFVFQKNDDLSDCVYSAEQTIEIGDVFASKLFMIAIIEWGSVEEFVRVGYCDGTSHLLDFYLIDSLNQTPRFDWERKLKNAEIAFSNRTIYDSVYTFYKIELSLDPAKAVKEVVLPLNTNLTVFAMSLQKTHG